MRKGNHTAVLGLVFALACASLAQQAPPPAPPAAPAPASPQAAAPPAAQVPAPHHALSVVVLDPGHGGTDPGARGATGIIEKDMTLTLARIVKAQLERQGFRVVLTRQADEDPSFDDRAAMANAERGAVFISLHVSSIGAAGTATAFYLPAISGGTPKPGPEAAASLVRWQDAQQKYLTQSRKLAEFIQVQLGQKLRGSPEVPLGAAVRQLRSVTAPAVAVELASVAVADRKSLDAAAPALAEAITRAVAAFKTTYDAGAN